MSNPTIPLQGLRVLELGNLIAAPYAGRLFAEFGAKWVRRMALKVCASSPNSVWVELCGQTHDPFKLG